MNKNQRRSAKDLWPLVADEIVDRAMNNLIPCAEGLIKDLFQNENHEMERSQLTNLVTTALETNSVATVLDYVRYQIGRDNRRKSWRAGQPGFGQKLIEQLEELRQEAGGLMENAIRKHGIAPEDRSAEEERLWMMLVRRFVGSLHRNFVYYDVYYADKRKRRGVGG